MSSHARKYEWILKGTAMINTLYNGTNASTFLIQSTKPSGKKYNFTSISKLNIVNKFSHFHGQSIRT